MKRILLFALVFVLAACAGGAGSEYSQNLAKWQDASIDHYRFTLFIGCFCAFMDQMPLTIEVDGGEVVSVTRADGTLVISDDPSYQFFEPYLTVDRLFFALEADLTGEADEVSVSYNSAYGFPVSIAVDRIKEAIDDEISFQVSEFEVLE